MAFYGYLAPVLHKEDLRVNLRFMGSTFSVYDTRKTLGWPITTLDIESGEPLADFVTIYRGWIDGNTVGLGKMNRREFDRWRRALKIQGAPPKFTYDEVVQIRSTPFVKLPEDLSSRLSYPGYRKIIFGEAYWWIEGPR